MEFNHNWFLIEASIREVSNRVWPRHSLQISYFDMLSVVYVQRVEAYQLIVPPV